MTRFASLSTVLSAAIFLAITTSLALVRALEESSVSYSAYPSRTLCDKNFTKEWADLSANDTRDVYNVGIGSLMSWASQQVSNQPIKPLSITTVSKVKRELWGCGRYQSMRALECEDEEPEETCPKMAVAYFKVEWETWKNLRTRECGYDVLLETEVEDKNAPPGYYFAWGDNPDKQCSPPRYPKFISQSYWDFIIGGIFSWDGQLTESGYYTWDWAAEDALGEEGMADRVHQANSLTYQERYDFALNFIKSTQFSPDFEWMDDRKCPFTNNAPITPVAMLDYPQDAYDDTEPLAIGSVSPLMSKEFYDFVDQLLIDGGWAYEGANNTIDNRTDRCDVAAEQGHKRSNFDPNPHYNDIIDWRTKNNFDDADDNETSKASDDASSTDEL